MTAQLALFPASAPAAEVWLDPNLGYGRSDARRDVPRGRRYVTVPGPDDWPPAVGAGTQPARKD